MLVNGSDFYCGNSAGSPCQFALKSMIPSAYVHPSTKQCNYSVDLSGYAKSSELNSLKSSVSSGKSIVASAVTGKGVSTAADASFQTIANNISNIETVKPFLKLNSNEVRLSSNRESGRNFQWSNECPNNLTLMDGNTERGLWRATSEGSTGSTYVLGWSSPDLTIGFAADLSYTYPDTFSIPLSVNLNGYSNGLNVAEIGNPYVHNGYYRHTFRLTSSGGGYTLPSGYSYYDFYIDVKGACSLTTIKSYKYIGMIPEDL